MDTLSVAGFQRESSIACFNLSQDYEDYALGEVFISRLLIYLRYIQHLFLVVGSVGLTEGSGHENIEING